MAWHGMAWNGMAWHDIESSDIYTALYNNTIRTAKPHNPTMMDLKKVPIAPHMMEWNGISTGN